MTRHLKNLPLAQPPQTSTTSKEMHAPTPTQSSLPTPNSTNSFWHSQPSSILLNHRTTEEVPETADVVVVGSGITGSFACRELVLSGEGSGEGGRKGVDVVLVEAREACWGATGRNGGHCQPLLYSRPPHLGHFEFRNYRHVKKLIADNEISCDWQSLSGCHAFFDLPMWENAQSEVAELKSLDPELGSKVNLITPTSISPSLADLRVPDALGAIITTEAASLWPYKLVAWVLEDLLARNASLGAEGKGSFNLQTNTPVTRVQALGGDLWAVHTPRGIITTKKVILATNAYTSHLLPSFSDLIVPVRGEMSSLVAPLTARPSETTRSLDTYTYGFIGNMRQNINQDDYLVQRPFGKGGEGGELMFGGARGYAKDAGIGVSDDSSIDAPAAQYLRRQLNIVLDLNKIGKDCSTSTFNPELKATYEWSGIMGYSRDSRPWVGELPRGIAGGEGLFICAGFTGHGMPNTTLCAKAVVEIMLGVREKGGEIDLPEEYEVSQERIEQARLLVDVKTADAMVQKF